MVDGLYRAYPNLDLQAFEQYDSDYRNQGSNSHGELISLSLYGDGEDPRVAAVWAMRPLGAPEQEVHYAWRESVDVLVDLLDGRGFSPQIVATTNSADRVRFAIVFRKRRPRELRTTLTLDVTAKSLERRDDPLDTQARLNYRIGWVSSYGRSFGPKGHLYAIIWQSQVRKLATPYQVADYDTVPWSVQPDLGAEAAAAQFDAFVEGHSRLYIKVPYCSATACYTSEDPTVFDEISGKTAYAPKFLTVWYGDIIGDWASKTVTSLDACEDLIDSPPFGYPIRIMASGSAKKPVFWLLFAKRDLPYPKRASILTPRAAAPQRRMTYVEIDDWIVELMKKNGLRRAQFALTRIGKLLAVRAYSHVESVYQAGRLTNHDMPFRVASLSKTLMALSLMKLHEGGLLAPPGVDSFNVSVGAYLGWGGKWQTAKLRYLLTHVNSIRPQTVTRFNPKLPGIETVVIKEPSDASFRDAWNAQPGPNIGLPLDDPKYCEPLLADLPRGTDGLWSYSGPAFVLAGQVLAHQFDGKPYADWFVEQLVSCPRNQFHYRSPPWASVVA